jgi:tetratricopeptide (TPR) repeat protein
VAHRTITILLIIGFIAALGLYQLKNRVWLQSPKVNLQIKKPHQGLSQLKDETGSGDIHVSLVDTEYVSRLKTLDNMLAANNRNTYALYRRAQLYADKGDIEKALSDYSRIIDINKDMDSYFNRGLLFMAQQKYDMAIIDFSQVIEMAPESIDSLSNRGSAYLLIGKLDMALNDYSTALGIDSKDSDLYFNRGVVYLRMKEKDKAEEDFKRAASMGNSMAREYLGWEE